jgi:hypothetical protein
MEIIMEKTMIIKKGTEFIDENMVMFRIISKYYDNYRCERYSFNFEIEEFDTLEDDMHLLTAAEVAHLAGAKKIIWEEDEEQ